MMPVITSFIQRVCGLFQCIQPPPPDNDDWICKDVVASPFRSRESSPVPTRRHIYESGCSRSTQSGCSISTGDGCCRSIGHHGCCTSTAHIHKSDNTSDLTECCTICLERLIIAQCYVLPRCGHMVHMTCMDLWSEKKAKCPVCNSSVAQCFGGVCIPNDIHKYIVYGAPKRKRIIRGHLAAKGLW